MWYLGIPSIKADATWLGYLRTAGGTIPGPPLAELEDSHLPAELDAGNDGIRHPDYTTNARLSTEQGDYVLACLSFASGDNIFSQVARKASRHFEPTILDLPIELRMQIFRHALVENDKIVIIRVLSVTPGLTRTNRQVREETMEIFLQENVFVLNIHDFYPVAPENFFIEKERLRHWLSKVAHLDYTWSGEHNWTNLRAWLQIHRANGVRPRRAEVCQSKWLSIRHC